MSERLGEADLPDILALHRLSLSQAAKPGLVKPDQPQFFAEHLDLRGRILGVREAGRLIAYAVLGLPNPGGPNMGEDLGLPAAAFPLVAHLAGAAVQPDARGHGLQLRLTEERIALAQASGRRHVLSTVSPFNYFSWRNLIAHGLLVRRLKTKYGGHLRYVLHRELGAEPALDRARARLLALGDAAAQGALLEQGWAGFALAETAGGLRIALAPVEESSKGGDGQ